MNAKAGRDRQLRTYAPAQARNAPVSPVCTPEPDQMARKKSAHRRRPARRSAARRSTGTSSRVPRKRVGREKADRIAEASGWMTPARIAEALRVDLALIHRHVKEGAPVDEAGRLHILQYAAWLNRRLADRNGRRPGQTPPE